MKIVQLLIRRKSEGLNSIALFFMNIAALTNTLNAIILEWNNEQCCTQIVTCLIFNDFFKKDLKIYLKKRIFGNVMKFY